MTDTQQLRRYGDFRRDRDGQPAAVAQALRFYWTLPRDWRGGVR